MKIESVSANRALVQLSDKELVIINNAINEICHVVVIPGFESRIGATKDETAALLHAIGQAVDQVAAATRE